MAITMLLTCSIGRAADNYDKDSVYQALRTSMHNAFNNGDSARFFPAVKALERYLYDKNDLHGYYTQRCNEIVFLMNMQRIIEAYKLAQALSKELREKKVDKEMYMAVNMMGHINRYCGNKEEAKKNWFQVLKMMEEEGYYSSMPPIYMNIVNVAIDDSPEEADSLLERAKAIARKYSQERVFDIETRQTLSYFFRGETQKFVEGYKAYKEGVKKGLTSVHGRSMEVYYQAYLGNTDEAVAMARRDMGDEGGEAIPMIYERAGRWKEAYEAFKKESAASDSIDNVVIMNSMQGISDELRLYDVERKASQNRLIMLTIVIVLLLLLIGTLFYIVQARRRHFKQLKIAYERALEADKAKTAFIQNVTHEVRTPLNIISGFSQVISDPDLDVGLNERKEIAVTMQKNTRLITSLIDEMLILSLTESSEGIVKDDKVEVNDLLRDFLQENERIFSIGTKLQFKSSLADDFTIQTNENLLKNIINALIDNAAKNTEKGYVTLRADLLNDKTVEFTVEDTGCGIPEDQAEHIFERFVKLDSFKEGIGLGLPMCRTLARKLGGSVRLELGAKLLANEKSPWTLDLNLTGYAGKKQGLQGGVSVKFMF